jgi:hypothetical protein
LAWQVVRVSPERQQARRAIGQVNHSQTGDQRNEDPGRPT